MRDCCRYENRIHFAFKTVLASEMLPGTDRPFCPNLVVNSTHVEPALCGRSSYSKMNHISIIYIPTSWDQFSYVTCLDTFFDLKLRTTEVCFFNKSKRMIRCMPFLLPNWILFDYHFVCEYCICSLHSFSQENSRSLASNQWWSPNIRIIHFGDRKPMPQIRIPVFTFFVSSTFERNFLLHDYYF